MNGTDPVYVLATRNEDKAREIRKILSARGIGLKSLSDFPGAPDVAEDGRTFLENAMKKARSCFHATGLPSLADDSGLEVDSLGGAPGVYSARYAGEGGDYRENNRKLLEEMQAVPRDKRTARFRCVVALVGEDQEAWVEGSVEGIILDECRGESGFGYDPVFYVPETKKTFAEMTPEEKNAISHRGIAFRKAAEMLKRGPA